MFGLYESRYLTDEDGNVHDSLVEYCIDCLCGTLYTPDYLPFAINRVFREYLFGLNHDSLLYRVVPIRHNVHIGFYFSADHNYMEDVWLGCVERLYLTVDSASVYRVSAPSGALQHSPFMTSGPVGLIGPDQHDLTLTLACLLLCRKLAAHKLTTRYKANNHKGASHGKDQAKI